MDGPSESKGPVIYNHFAYRNNDRPWRKCARVSAILLAMTVVRVEIRVISKGVTPMHLGREICCRVSLLLDNSN